MGKIIAFSHIEKCAGTTLISAFRSLYGINHFDVIPVFKNSMLLSEDDLKIVLRLNPWVKSLAGHSLRVYLPWSEKYDFLWVTVLRDPISRMVSDYNYHCDKLGYVGEYERFIDLKSRANFLVKSICGSDDVDAAKLLLKSSFSLVGTVDRISSFMVELTNITGAKFDFYKRSRVNKTGYKKIRVQDLTKEQMGKTIEACRLDIQLYEYLIEELIGESGCYINNDKFKENISGEVKPSRMKYIAGNIYRNFIYKPCCGYLPLKRHALPQYRGEDG